MLFGIDYLWVRKRKYVLDNCYVVSVEKRDMVRESHI